MCLALRCSLCAHGRHNVLCLKQMPSPSSTARLRSHHPTVGPNNPIKLASLVLDLNTTLHWQTTFLRTIGSTTSSAALLRRNCLRYGRDRLLKTLWRPVASQEQARAHHGHTGQRHSGPRSFGREAYLHPWVQEPCSKWYPENVEP